MNAFLRGGAVAPVVAVLAALFVNQVVPSVVAVAAAAVTPALAAALRRYWARGPPELVFTIARVMAELAPGRLGHWFEQVPDRWANAAYRYLVERAQYLLARNRATRAGQLRRLGKTPSQQERNNLRNALREIQERAEQIPQLLEDRLNELENRIDRNSRNERPARSGRAFTPPPKHEGPYLRWAAERNRNKEKRLAAALAKVRKRRASARDAGAWGRVHALDERASKLQVRLWIIRDEGHGLDEIPGAGPRGSADRALTGIAGRLRASAGALGRWIAAHRVTVLLVVMVVPAATALALLLSLPAQAAGPAIGAGATSAPPAWLAAALPLTVVGTVAVAVRWLVRQAIGMVRARGSPVPASNRRDRAATEPPVERSRWQRWLAAHRWTARIAVVLPVTVAVVLLGLPAWAAAPGTGTARVAPVVLTGAAVAGVVVLVGFGWGKVRGWWGRAGARGPPARGWAGLSGRYGWSGPGGPDGPNGPMPGGRTPIS